MTEEEENNKEEEVKEDGYISDDKPAPEKKQEPVFLPTIPKPTATVARKPSPEPSEKPPETASGIDVTANMDADQKMRFERIKREGQAIPAMVDVERDFCKKHRAIKARRKERRAAMLLSG